MGPEIIAIITLAALILLFVSLNVKILQVGKAAVIERMGAYQKTITEPGIFFIIPIFDRVVQTVDLSEQTKKWVYKDLDNITIKFVYKVVDVKSFVYGSLDSLKTIEDIIETTYAKHGKINQESIAFIEEKSNLLGVQVIDIIEL